MMTTASLISILLSLALGGTPADQAGEESLQRLLEQYLTGETASAKQDLVSQIHEAANGDVFAVSQALSRVQLWPKLPEREGFIEFGDLDKGRKPISLRLPKDYNPTTSYPAIVCFLGSGKTDGKTLDKITAILGAAADDFVLIHQNYFDGQFSRRRGVFPNPASIVRDICRRIHLDHNRIFLFGNDDGASAAWEVALFHPHTFAGVIIVDGLPLLPYPAQTYPFLLENLRWLPVLLIEQAVVSESERAHLDGIRGLAKDLRLPMQFTDLTASSERQRAAPLPSVTKLLARRRAPRPLAVAHWFRVPNQRHASWLHQTEFKGDVWRAEALSIVASPTVDRDTYITETIKSKLAYVGGRIDGQRLEIETRRCARIEITLWDGLIDWKQPITITINGKKRYEGAVAPDIHTLLESANRDWGLTRLPLVRLAFSVKTDSPIDSHKADGNPQ